MFSLTILGLVAAYMAVLFAVAWHQERPAARARGKGLGKRLFDHSIVHARTRGVSMMFIHALSDAYSAEKQMTRSLPKMAKAATAPELKKAFETHREETEGQVERLGQVFEIIGKAPRAKTCDAILGILEEGKAVMEDYADSPALDAGLVA